MWPDLVVDAHLDRSLTTIKADAAERTYGCSGTGVVWGVLDSGIDENHPHFTQYETLTADAVKDLHRDFSLREADIPEAPLTDVVGHGTHVAGIIAGCAPTDTATLRIALNEPTAQDFPLWTPRTLAPGTTLSGVAPRANLVSLKVLDDNSKTLSSVIIDALDYVREINSYGRELQIHGVNLSLGCGWLPKDYAAGQSPLCRELDLLVGTGVIAVVSAGNSGAGGQQDRPEQRRVRAAVHHHRSRQRGDRHHCRIGAPIPAPHLRHHFRLVERAHPGRPDETRPGRPRRTHHISGHRTARRPRCAVGARRRRDRVQVARYIEDSGTSMAAAHVSGVIAALLSARTEYIGQPDLVKRLLTSTASDLGRHQFFQGAGLIDLMRALSST